MKHLLLLFCFGFICLTSNAQTVVGNTEETRDLYASARTYLQKSDYANAIMVYNQAIQLEPKNLIYRRELAHAYYLNGDMMRGSKMITPLLKDDEADEETFQVACKIYTTMKETDNAKDAINKGIAKFPNSGILYAEKGEFYTNQKKYKEAAEAWEKGVEKDPKFYLNYYNLSKVYFFTKKYFWSLYYGEIYVNLQRTASKTEEIKQNVFESYKFLMADLNNQALDGKQNRYDNPKTFEAACLKTFDNLRNVVTGGINTENLIMLRVRFLFDWNKYYARMYPTALYDFQQSLILNGQFSCYNQWLFGHLNNDKEFKAWVQANANSMNEFNAFYKNSRLVPKENQYYHNN